MTTLNLKRELYNACILEDQQEAIRRIDFLREAGLKIDRPFDDGRSALMVAVKSHRYVTAYHLLGYCPNLDERDQWNLNILQMRGTYEVTSIINQNPECQAFFNEVERRINANKQQEIGSGAIFNALLKMVHVSSSFRSALQVYLLAGYSINMTNSEGNTLFMQCLIQKAYTACLTLLEFGASPNALCGSRNIHSSINLQGKSAIEILKIHEQYVKEYGFKDENLDRLLAALVPSAV